MTLLSVLASLVVVFAFVDGDIYMHVPRGSNNRLHGQNRNRRNGNRLFDSQNNNRGGYNVGGDPSKGLTPRMKYIAGSIMNIEWTNQHECGGKNDHCDVIMQYMCDPELRDGTTTNTIPANLNEKRKTFGRHESQEYYARCKTRHRNENLYHADQRLRGNAAIYTRQNRNGNRRGLECPEEKDYWPYWSPTPWKDVAILTNHLHRCEHYRNESQNVKGRGYCDFPTNVEFQIAAARNPAANKDKLTPTTKAACEAKRGANNKNYIWKEVPAHGIPAPDCRQSPQSRDNHLGNTYSKEGSTGSKKIPQTFSYKWKIPNTTAKNCVFRIRYNISIGDYPPFQADASNDIRSRQCLPTLDVGKDYGMSAVEAKKRGYYLKNDPRLKVLKTDEGIIDKLELRLAINTAQTGRTFQDRSHAFDIVARPANVPNNATIHNVQVRGKRGNIVQTFPATEYDFAPNDLTLQKDDYVHMQWTGSLRNPRNNAGEGARGTDKSNVINLRPRNYGGEQPKMMHGYPGNLYPQSIHEDTFLNLGKNFAYKASIIVPGLLPERLNIKAIQANTSSCIKEPGFCVKSNGDDQNDGTIHISRQNAETAQAQQECLKRCAGDPKATGCEVIWNQGNRGCYVHTKKITAGNNRPNHACWVFWKCKVPDLAPLAAPVPPPTRYKSMGCWNDGATPAINGTKTIVPTDTKNKCFERALKEGNKYFAVQNRFDCYTSKTAGSTYSKYKKTAGCAKDGTGGVKKMNVYRIENFGNMEADLLMAPIRLQKGRLIARLTELKKAYTVQFEVYPDSYKRGWHNVIHLTIGQNIQKYGSRTPGVWYHPNARGALHICAPISRNRNHCKNTKNYPVKQWLKVKISQQMEGDEEYYYQIELNGETIYKRRNDKPMDFKNVMVYAGDPWYRVQAGALRGFSIDNHVVIQKGRKLKTLPQLMKEYSVKFQLFPTKILPGMKSVLHLTKGGDAEEYGDRTPGVFMEPGKLAGTGKLSICTAANGEANHCFSPPQPIAVNKWTSVAITQTAVIAYKSVKSLGVAVNVAVSTDYTYAIAIDGKNVHEMKNTEPELFANVHVYVGDVFYEAQEGYIQGLDITGVNYTKLVIAGAPPILTEAQEITKGTLIKTLEKLNKEFTVEFEVELANFKRGWRNLFHMTNGGDNTQYGSRHPAIYFSNNVFYVAAAISGNRNKWWRSKPLGNEYLATWLKFKMQQKKEGTQYVFTVEFDGVQIGKSVNTQPRAFYNVKVYASDPWYTPVKGFIQKLVIQGEGRIIPPKGEYVKATFAVVPKQSVEGKQSIRVMCRRPSRDYGTRGVNYGAGKMYLGNIDTFDEKFDRRQIITWENTKAAAGRCQWIGWESNTFADQMLKVSFWIKFLGKVPPMSADFGVRVCDKVHNDWVKKCKPNKWCSVDKSYKCVGSSRRVAVTFNSVKLVQKVRVAHLQVQILGGKPKLRDEEYAYPGDAIEQVVEEVDNGDDSDDIDYEKIDTDDNEETEDEQDGVELNEREVNDPRNRRRRRRNGNAKGFDLTTLNDAPPYVDLGAQKVETCGRWSYMSTRNNNFSNRSQKGKITVVCENKTNKTTTDGGDKKPPSAVKPTGEVKPGPTLLGSNTAGDTNIVDMDDLAAFDLDSF